MEVTTAYVAKLVDCDDYNQYTTQIISIGIEREPVWNAFLDKMPNRIEHWCKRYCEWDASTLKCIEEIYPNLHSHAWFTVINVNDGDNQFRDEPLYDIQRHWDKEDCAEYKTALLTREQKAKLFNLLGGTWYPSRHTHHTYRVESVVLVPTQVIE